MQVNETAERMCDCSCSKSDPDRPVRYVGASSRIVGSRRPNFVSQSNFLHTTEVERAGKTGHAVTGIVGFITSSTAHMRSPLSRALQTENFRD